MTLTKNAIGNLINKYRAVLSKCRLLNTLGSLAVAGALVLGMGGVGVAADSGGTVNYNTTSYPGTPVYAGTYVPGGSTGNASGNNVHIDTGNSNMPIYGGFVDTGGRGDANNNRVTMTGGEASWVMGGSVGGIGNANNNTVTISGGKITTEVYGGRSYNDNANNNRVTISGGYIGGSVYGGYAVNNGGGSPSANNNRVTISGGYIGGNVLGGYAGGTGKAENNTVIYSGGMINGGLYGGYSATPGNSRNNTLVSIGNRTVGGDVSHFQNYHFVLGTNNVGLTADGQFYMDKGSQRILGVDILGGGSLPKEGGKLTLAKGAGGVTLGGTLAGTSGTGKKGATMLFDYSNVAVNGNKLEATVSNVRVNPQAKSLSEGVLANAALVNMGAEAVAGAGMASAIAATANSAPSGTTTLAPFGTLQAGHSRYETGSHVDVTGMNFIAGIAMGLQTDFGKFLVGPFFEAGFGSYNAHNSFDNADSVNAEGRTNYLGAGILARMDFADIFLGHPYLEGSFRIGHTSNSYDTEDITDGAGRTVEYDTDAPFHSFHVGLGYLFNLTETDHLDVYGKYFWSHLGGADVKVLGDPIEFDDVNSSRLRFGARYSHDFGTDRNYSVSPYIGLAYEHEFDGKARATTYGQDIKAPTLKGDTGIGELGVTLRHQNGFSLDFGLSGYVGNRKGVMGNMLLKYEF